jgi:hypothetical protein
MIKAARIKFDKLKGETPKAYLIQIEGVEHWIPKSQCCRFTTNNKLGGNVEISTFIINRMFDIDINIDCPDFIKPTWIVANHTPEKLEPLQDNTIQDLKR